MLNSLKKRNKKIAPWDSSKMLRLWGKYSRARKYWWAGTCGECRDKAYNYAKAIAEDRVDIPLENLNKTIKFLLKMGLGQKGAIDGEAINKLVERYVDAIKNRKISVSGKDLYELEMALEDSNMYDMDNRNIVEIDMLRTCYDYAGVVRPVARIGGTRVKKVKLLSVVKMYNVASRYKRAKKGVEKNSSVVNILGKCREFANGYAHDIAKADVLKRASRIRLLASIKFFESTEVIFSPNPDMGWVASDAYDAVKKLKKCLASKGKFEKVLEWSKNLEQKRQKASDLLQNVKEKCKNVSGAIAAGREKLRGVVDQKTETLQRGVSYVVYDVVPGLFGGLTRPSKLKKSDKKSRVVEMQPETPDNNSDNNKNVKVLPVMRYVASFMLFLMVSGSLNTSSSGRNFANNVSNDAKNAPKTTKVANEEKPTVDAVKPEQKVVLFNAAYAEATDKYYDVRLDKLGGAKKDEVLQKIENQVKSGNITLGDSISVKRIAYTYFIYRAYGYDIEVLNKVVNCESLSPDEVAKLTKLVLMAKEDGTGVRNMARSHVTGREIHGMCANGGEINKMCANGHESISQKKVSHAGTNVKSSNTKITLTDILSMLRNNIENDKYSLTDEQHARLTDLLLDEDQDKTDPDYVGDLTKLLMLAGFDKNTVDQFVHQNNYSDTVFMPDNYVQKVEQQKVEQRKKPVWYNRCYIMNRHTR